MSELMKPISFTRCVSDDRGSVYVFGNGYGQDIVYEYDWTTGNVDTVLMAEGISPDDVTVTRDRCHLYLNLNDGADRLTLQYWFYNDVHQVERVSFADGTTWDAAELTQWITVAPGTECNDAFFGREVDDTLDGQDGDDRLEGGGGNLITATHSHVLRWRCAGVAMLLSLLAVPLIAAGKESEPAYAGEFILSRNQFHDPICEPFTRNLNQFRKLSFTQCHPRLSEKFPEFSRPKWEEIPFDFDLAKVGVNARWRSSPSRMEWAWHEWKAGVQPLVERNEAHMWQTSVDIDGDGRKEILIRMNPGSSGLPPKIIDSPPYNCDYNVGAFFLTKDARPQLADAFQSHRGSDLIRYAGNNRYYMVLWNPAGPAYPQIDIGATAGVVLSQINWNGREGYSVSGGEICLIDWVPTGQYRPLKHPAKSTN